MKKSVVAVVMVAVGLGVYVLVGRQPTAPESPAPTPDRPQTAPVPPAASGPDVPERHVSIPDIADRVAPPPLALAGARATIVSPVNGAVVPRSFTVRMTVAGMTLAPAGSENPRAGHFHLLIDTAPSNLKGPIVRDARHLDFGGGDSEVVIELPAGPHTLQLLFGDGNHVPYDPPVLSTPVAITVRDSRGA